MKLSAFTLSQLEQAVNKLIALDPETGDRVNTVDGCTVSVRLSSPELDFFMTSGDGRLIMSPATGADSDSALTGSMADFARTGYAGICGNPPSGQQIKIAGNQETGHAFLEILSRLSIDWEEQLSHITGDVIAHQLGRFTRQVARSTDNLGSTLRSNLSEYLQEELRAVPTRIEIDNLFTDIANLKTRVDAIGKRFQQPGKTS